MNFYSKFFTVYIFVTLLLVPVVYAQIPIPASTVVSERFNGIGNTAGPLPANWKMSSAGTGLTSGWATGTNITSTTQAANSGSPTNGGAYNWGTSSGTDRAIGFMGSGSYASPNSIIAFYRNTTGATVNSITIGFQVERYRINTSSFSLNFFSSTDGTTWTARTGGDISTAGFINGSSSYTFVSPQTILRTVTITGLSILNNGDFYLRWLFTDASAANGQGAALDNVNLFAGTATPVLLGKLRDQLTIDNPPVNQANSGDQLTYTTVIKNTGSGDASNVTLTEPAPANTTLTGSVTTSALARDDNYSTSFNTALTGNNVLTNDFGLPLPTVVSFGPSANGAATAAGGTGSSDNGGTVVVNSNGTFTYTPPTGFNGIDKFSYTATTGTSPDNDAIVTIIVGTAPSSVNDNYAVTGNVSINHAAGAGVLSNDGGSGLIITAVNGNAANVGSPISTAQGGNLTVQGDGSFTYNPAPGYEGSDNFTYTIDNNFGISSTATVTFTVSGMIWFINNSAGSAGDGRLSSPFNTLAAFTAINNGTGNNPASADNIFLYTGAGNYTGGTTLLNNQRLIGQGASASLVTITGITLAAGSTSLPTTGGTNPVIVNAAGNGIAVGANNTIRGLSVGNCSGNGISGTGFATLSVSDAAINTNGQALSLSNGTLNGTFSTVSSSGGVNGILLSTVAGSTAINGGTISGNSGANVSIAGGTTSLTYSGSITQANNAAMVSISGGHATGTITFQTGTLSATNGTGLQFDNADGIYNFNGIVTLNGGDAGIDVINGSSGNLSFLNTAITNPSGTALLISGGNGTISHAGTLSKNNAGRLIDIQARNGGSVTVSGNLSATVSCTGINVSTCTAGTVTFSGSGKTLNTPGITPLTLTNNSGTTIDFPNGGLTINSSTATGFSATGGAAAVHVTGTGNTISSTTGTALNVANTTIGSGGLNFQSISSNGSSSGIILNNTGTSGGLSVSGSGIAGSGGTIQNTTSHGISLISTTNPSFSYMNIQNTAGSGIKGTATNGFTCLNSTINNSGTGGGVDESNIAFNTTAGGTEQNLTGTVTISNNTLTNARYHGVEIFNFNGTISNAIISFNTLTSGTTTATSLGSAIMLIAFGSATTVANVTKATISNNVITNFPSGAGIQAQGGNANASGVAGVFGTSGSVTDIINITSNQIKGASTTVTMGTSAIIALVNGKGQGNFNISGNGTIANPISNIGGTAISNSAFGAANVTSTINNNFIVANNFVGSQGIGAGLDNTFGLTDAPSLNITINNNTISNTDGNGILAVARNSNGVLRAKIQNNTVSAPLGGVRPGIRVDAGSASGNVTVCLNISGNISAGSGGTNGIGLRKQGAVSTTNVFGVNGMAATSSPGIESYINGLNPAGNGTLLISATSGFVSCVN